MLVKNFICPLCNVTELLRFGRRAAPRGSQESSQASLRGLTSSWWWAAYPARAARWAGGNQKLFSCANGTVVRFLPLLYNGCIYYINPTRMEPQNEPRNCSNRKSAQTFDGDYHQRSYRACRTAHLRPLCCGMMRTKTPCGMGKVQRSRFLSPLVLGGRSGQQGGSAIWEIDVSSSSSSGSLCSSPSENRQWRGVVGSISWRLSPFSDKQERGQGCEKWWC